MVVKWSELTVYEKKKEEDVVAPWLMVLESVGDNTHLKIESEGEWRVLGSFLPACGPDGLAGLILPNDQLVVAGCRFGALIGKFGGSSAAHRTAQPDASAADATAQSDTSTRADEPFATGAFCLLKLPTGVIGPLFIGFNTPSRPVRVTKLTVKVSGARPTTT